MTWVSWMDTFATSALPQMSVHLECFLDTFTLNFFKIRYTDVQSVQMWLQTYFTFYVYYTSRMTFYQIILGSRLFTLLL